MNIIVNYHIENRIILSKKFIYSHLSNILIITYVSMTILIMTEGAAP